MVEVRIGVIGLGNVGSAHATQLFAGRIENAVLAAVCDTREERIEVAQKEFSKDVQTFLSIDEFFQKAKIDGVIIATPHYSHPELAIKAFEKGLHVLCEKPAGVYTKQVRLMNEAAEKSNRVFSIMFNQRTNPLYKSVKELIALGGIGEIRRTNWTITDWYRSQYYYDSASWRATWAGEGGGILLNQATHQLDLWLWITGMIPTRVHGFCSFGKRRNIEVEDEVTAYVEYENGGTGLFVSSVSEAPGVNRLEIIGDKGKVIIEDDQVKLYQLTQSETEFNIENKEIFGSPVVEEVIFEVEHNESGHHAIIANWVSAILQHVPLIAPGIEGIHSLIVSNAIYLSSWTKETIELPLDEDLFYQMLQERIAASKMNH